MKIVNLYFLKLLEQIWQIHTLFQKIIVIDRDKLYFEVLCFWRSKFKYLPNIYLHIINDTNVYSFEFRCYLVDVFLWNLFGHLLITKMQFAVFEKNSVHFVSENTEKISCSSLPKYDTLLHSRKNVIYFTLKYYCVWV